MDLDNILPTRTRTRKKVYYNETKRSTNGAMDEIASQKVCHGTQNGRIRKQREQHPKRKQKQVLITRSFVNDYAVTAECSIKFKNNMSDLNDPKIETGKEIEDAIDNNVASSTANGGEKLSDENISDSMFHTSLRDDTEICQNQDDSISLFASSIDEENFENPTQQSSSEDNTYVLDWLEHVPNQNGNNEGPMSNRNHHNNVQHRRNHPKIQFTNWHNNNNMMTNFNNTKTFLLKEMNDVCKFYFFEGNCIYRKCRFSHCLLNTTKDRLLKLPFEKFEHIYNVSKEFRNLYFPILELYVHRLVLKQRRDELVSLVDDILSHECLDRSQYIEQIVCGLQKIGFSLSEAITKIFSSQSKKGTSSCVNEILLNIVVRKSSNLEENWYVVKKLTEGFQEMDFGVVTDIIQACLDRHPPSYSFCAHICTDILEKFDVNLSNIPQSLLCQFKELLRKMELTVYADNMDFVQETLGDPSANYEVDMENEDVNEQFESELVYENVDDFAVEDDGTYFVNEPTKLDDNDDNVNNENETSAKLKDENTVTLIVNEIPTGTVICSDINVLNENENDVIEKAKQNGVLNQTSDETVSSTLTRCFQNVNPCSEELVSFSNQQNNEENTVMYTVEQTNNVSCSNDKIDTKLDESVDNEIITPPTEQVSDKIKITSILNLPPNSPAASTKLNIEPMIYEEEEEDEDESTLCIESIGSSSNFHIELLDADIVRLNEVIKKESVDGFTKMLRKNKCVYLQKSFVLNVIVMLKNQNKLCKDYVETLLKFQKTLIGNDPDMNTLVKSLALNLIESLGEKGKWKRACNIFKLFPNIEDVINSDCYVNKKSLLQRYIFSCLILIRGDELDAALNLLKNSKVNVLDVSTWTDYEERDVLRLMTMLNEFFEAALEKNLLFQTYDLICHVIRKEYVLKVDSIWTYLNGVIEKMNLDFGTYGDKLHATLNNILSDTWDIKNFSVSTIRRLFVVMFQNGFQTSALNLYKKCCQFGIYYNRYDGSERSVIIRIDMTIEEMIMVIADFLSKLVKGKSRISDVTVHVCFPLNVDETDSVRDSLPQVSLVKKNVQKILTCLMRPISVSFSDDGTDVVLKASDIQAYIKLKK